MVNPAVVTLAASGVLPASGVVPASGVASVSVCEVTGAINAMQWSLAIFLALLEATILVLIWKRIINLEKLISEQDGAASFSRFQFLIFTFIIASAYIVLAFYDVCLGKGLPAIDPSVLGLIGISGGSYLVSKGIEVSGNAGAATPPPAQPQEHPPVG